VVALGGPLRAHPSRTLEILERVVEGKQRDGFLVGDLADELVQRADLRFGVRPAVVPRQDVHECHT
jgi:hypothetical protein